MNGETFEYFAEVAPRERQYFDIVPLSAETEMGASAQCGNGCMDGFALTEDHRHLVCEGCGARYKVERAT